MKLRVRGGLILTAAAAAVFLTGVTTKPQRGVCGFDARPQGSSAYYDRDDPGSIVVKRWQVARTDPPPTQLGWPTIGYVYRTKSGAYALHLPPVHDVVVTIAADTPAQIRHAMTQALAQFGIPPSASINSPVYRGIVDGSVPIASLPCVKLH